MVSFGAFSFDIIFVRRLCIMQPIGVAKNVLRDSFNVGQIST
jgi:hypothetical protein